MPSKRKGNEARKAKEEGRREKKKVETDFYTFNILNPKTFYARPNFASQYMHLDEKVGKWTSVNSFVVSFIPS